MLETGLVLKMRRDTRVVVLGCLNLFWRGCCLLLVVIIIPLASEIVWAFVFMRRARLNEYCNRLVNLGTRDVGINDTNILVPSQSLVHFT